MRTHHHTSFPAAAIAGAIFSFAIPLAAQQTAPANAHVEPGTSITQPADPPLPAGAADSLEARMAARRAAQASAPAGGGFGGGGFGGPGAAVGGRGGRGGINLGDQLDAQEKKNAPVYESADPNMIEISDKIITQIIPLKYIDATRTRNDLTPMISNEADATVSPGANCIIITDKSSRVHRLVEIISKLDVQGAVRANSGMTTPAGTMTVISGPATGRGFAGVLALPPGTYSAMVTAPTATITVGGDHMVAEVLVSEGQSVHKGDILVSLDNGQEAAELRVAQARLELARARLQAASAAPEHAQAQAEVAVQEAIFELQKKRVEALQLKAPFDGVLTAFDIKPGQPVRSGERLTQVVGKELALTAMVPAGTANGWKPGQRLQFSWSTEITGTVEVTFISPVADGTTGTVEVHAKFTDPPGGLKPGMNGLLKIGDK